MTPQNRRSAIRKNVSVPCQIVRHEDTQVFAETTRDLSEDGMQIASDACLAVGDTVTVSFQTSDLGLWVDAGATVGTHLFNAMRPFQHRDPGTAGAALARARHAEIIPDLQHVAPGAILAALRAVPQLYCITDAMEATGMPDGGYRLGTHAVTKHGAVATLADGDGACEAQVDAVIELLGGIVQRHGITRGNVVGHSDVAPARKEDPGELFPWYRLARLRLALPRPNRNLMDPHWSDAGFLLALERFGYDVTDGVAAIRAFQRRFRPEMIDGIIDGECRAILLALLLPKPTGD